MSDAPSIYPIRLYGDPVLRRKARPLAHTDTLELPGFGPQNLRQVADTMLETMFEARGVGLAAPQVGLGVRMFVAVEYEDDEEENEGQETPLKSRVLREFVMLNPRLSVIDKKKVRSETEGCLSIPDIYEEGVPRARAVRLDYTDLDGRMQSVEAEDYLARVFQHEFDHLEGKLFIDYLPQDTVNEYRGALLAMQRQAKQHLDRLRHQAADGHRHERL
ncbi:peptide deformylase [Deinococcus radiophilus]|uniref:Peptide deformylase n=1 Tax=Deinococcus radiophilus TaxID=32062 RepID=A0A3S0RJH5_9DEIO|nr:peptide deformylase [Deinococcus radiophilus]RTR29903.1 peptide deformylase [Deinococcus radiophilus]UFA49743.1 peptide deformylase [Deinococcus radiophilus]